MPLIGLDDSLSFEPDQVAAMIEQGYRDSEEPTTLM